jgi:DNA invertase Pin-like site-specific DNA recombinase
MSKATVATPARVDVVFIRKSSHGQDDKAQADTVRAMLRDAGVYVQERYWFLCTVPRARVQGNAELRRLMELVEARKVGTVYAESLDRLGTGGIGELFALIGTLADHGTRLHDPRDRTDYTAADDARQFKTFLGGLKSKKEREAKSSRSLRARVSLFKDTGSWAGSGRTHSSPACCETPPTTSTARTITGHRICGRRRWPPKSGRGAGPRRRWPSCRRNVTATPECGSMRPSKCRPF